MSNTPLTERYVHEDDLPSTEDLGAARRSGVGACIAATGSALFLGLVV